jgi:hypothetical protein
MQPFAQLNTLSVPGSAGRNSPLLTAKLPDQHLLRSLGGWASLPYQG